MCVIVRNNLWDWQSLSPSSGSNTSFQAFCDALEVKDGVNAGPAGWGLDHALKAWGNHWNATYYRQRMSASLHHQKNVVSNVFLYSLWTTGCRVSSQTGFVVWFLSDEVVLHRTCLGSYDPTQSFWTNTTVNNAGRSWTWFV